MINNCIQFEEFIFPPQEEGMGYIYHLLDDQNRILYIGKTNNLLQRIGKHWGDKVIPFVRCRYYSVINSDLDLAETQEILHHNPQYNKSIPSNQIYFSYERYKKINPLVKGKSVKVRKAIKHLNIKDINGFIHFEDWKIICHFLENGATK